MSFDGGETWKNTNIFNDLYYIDEKDVDNVSWYNLSFDELLDISRLNNNEFFLYSRKEKPSFFKKDKNTTDILFFSGFIMDKNFTRETYKNNICLKVEYIKIDNYTIKNLAKNLTANEFCEYLKDKGVICNYEREK